MENIIISQEKGYTFENFYNDIKASPNNFSFWYPKIQYCGLPVPSSVVVPVPIEVVLSFCMERSGDGVRVMDFIKNSLIPAIPEYYGHRVFLKNGCFSDKFHFNQCSPEVTPEALFRSVTNINMDSLCFDTGGNAEIVVRRLVGTDDLNFTATIYNGMRLRPEIRVFYDFDKRKVLYSVNYWNWDYCHDAIARNEDDRRVYEKVYPLINLVYWAQKDYILELIYEKMRNVDLQGIWSIDLMYADNKWWLIDMALGHMSAYWDPKKIEFF